MTPVLMYRNRRQLARATAARGKDGLDRPPRLLAHIFLPGWTHIPLAGECRWRVRTNQAA